MIVEITNENYESEVLRYEGTAVVDFYAVWCGPCKMQSPIIEELAAERPDVKFCKLDTDAAPVIAIQNGITSIPTIMVFKNGEVVHKEIGLTTKAELIQLIG